MQTCRVPVTCARCGDLLQLEHQLRLLGDALGVDLAFDQYTRARLASGQRLRKCAEPPVQYHPSPQPEVRSSWLTGHGEELGHGEMRWPAQRRELRELRAVPDQPVGFFHTLAIRTLRGSARGLRAHRGLSLASRATRRSDWRCISLTFCYSHRRAQERWTRPTCRPSRARCRS